MFKITILSFLLLSSLNAECGKGCLKCKKNENDSTYTCQLCDILSNYYLNDKTCQVATLQNCSQINHSNQCVKCNKNYYLTNGNCVAVDTQQLVTNCELYDHNQNCQFCQSGYYLLTNTCVAVENKILNCVDYSSSTECMYCSKNYFLSYDKKQCSQLDQQCLGYTDINCLECKSGYIMNKRYYKTVYFKFDTNSQRDQLLQFLLPHKEGQGQIMYMPSCQAITATNCATYKSYNECETCISNYYLNQTTKLCTPIPEPIIVNCNVYEFHNVEKWKYKCSQCINKYYLASDYKTCVLATGPDFCSQWDGTTTVQKCTACQSDRILKDGNCTKLRVNKNISRCKTYQIDEDKCSQCEDGYVLNNDKLLCKTKILNCQTHDTNFSSSDVSVKCTKCIDLHYLTDDNRCVQGNLNCQVYNSEKNCQICKNQYQSPTTCLHQHSNIAQCSVYSQLDIFRCVKCENKHFASTIKSQCHTYAEINNCASHNAVWQGDEIKVTCTACKNEYELSNNTCISISSPSNCIQKNGTNSCTLCQDKYYLAQDKTDNNLTSCQDVQEHVTSKCDSYLQTTGFTEENSCTICSEDSYFRNEKQCIKKSSLKYLSSNTPSDLSGLTECVEVNDQSQCIRCNDTHALSGHDCVNSCPNTLNLVNVDSTSGLGGLKCTAAMTTPADYGQTDISYNVDGTNIIAISCKKDTLTLLNQDGTRSSAQNPYFTLGNTGEKPYHNIADVHQEIICPNLINSGYLNDKIADNSIITSITNQTVGLQRKIWQKKTIAGPVDLYLRVGCGWGQEGKIKKGTDSSSYYLDCGTYANTPFSSVRYGGVPLLFSNLVNSHKCNNDNSLATVVMRTMNTSPYKFDRFEPYNFEQDNLLTATNDNSLTHMICLDNSSVANLKSSLKISVNDTNVNIMQNCGLALLDLAKYNDKTTFNNTYYDLANTDTNYNNYQSLRCLACKPGYKKTDANSNTDFVGKCVHIDNCSTSDQNIFNSCNKCQNEYSLKATADGVIDFQTCVKIPSSLKNCYAYVRDDLGSTTDLTGYCKYCDKGYSINKDGYCEQQQQPACENDSFQETYTKPSSWTSNNKQIFEYFTQKGQGCQKCASSYILYAHKTNQCFESKQLKDLINNDLTNTKIIASNDVRTTSNFIVRCLKYTTNNLCEVCVNGYILTQNKMYCLKKANEGLLKLQNCHTADNGKQNCLICDNGYSLVSHGCQKGTISNCKEYETSNNNNVITCKTCESGYWLQSNTSNNVLTSCEKGLIQNCDQYDTGIEDCKKCKDGYWNFAGTQSTNTKYCLPIDTSMHCKDVLMNMQSENIGGNNYQFVELDCHTCDSFSLRKANSVHQPKCQPIWSDNNCEINSHSSKLGNTEYSFLCSQCVSNQYISTVSKNQLCKARTKTYENCEENVLDKDFCKKCKPQHYLSDDQKSCIKYPTGKYGCTKYNNDLKCLECDKDHYFNLDTCIKTNTFVANCNLYKANGKCLQCASGYFLSHDVLCQQFAQGLNCQDYVAFNSCKNCPTSYKLVTEDGINKCVSVPIPANCSIVDVQTGLCSQCAKDFFIIASGAQKGQCKFANPVIENCIIMTTETTCQKCDYGYALTLDKTQCLTGTGLQNVCYGEYIQNPLCTVCKVGQCFENGVCSNNNTSNNMVSMEGCFKQTDDDKYCELCISGWSMSNDGKCTDNNPSTPGPGKKNMMITQISMMILFILFQVI